MHSPIAALIWEMWRRGRLYAALVAACVVTAVLIHGLAPRMNFVLYQVLGMLMALSVVLLLGILNCTQYDRAREWSGFPYRWFVLPVPTWQLVAIPMVTGLVAVAAVYFAWVKLVWTSGEFERPGWYGAVLGAFAIYYQMTLWSLAGFRILRTIVLSIGGVGGILIGFLPAFGKFYPESFWWLSEEHLLPLVLTVIPVGFIIAAVAVSWQRHAGGRRRNWLKALVEWSADHLPRRAGNFASLAAAQFWYEWRRIGWLLPVNVAFGLFVVIAPLSWKFGDDAHFTSVTFCWIMALPVVLGILLGRGLTEGEFHAGETSLPPFLAARPIASADVMVARLKVLALSAAMAWLLVVAFLGVWLSFWANPAYLKLLFFEFRMFYPHSWPVIAGLGLAGLVVLTWRFLVSELWSGLSRNRFLYYGSLGGQIVLPLLLLIAAAIWSDAIDHFLKQNPSFLKTDLIQIAGWVLAGLVAGKLWLAVWTWSRVDARRVRRYWVMWIGGTTGLVVLAILARPPADVERQHHIFLLVALLLFPLARVGAAIRLLDKNRAR